MLVIIQSLIPNKKWRSLPRAARNAITEVDFKARASDLLKSIKPKAFKALKVGRPICLKDFCAEESKSLVQSRKISLVEEFRFRDYFVEQVTGAVAGKKDRDGLRLYLCVGNRTYVDRLKASPREWAEYTEELARERDGTRSRFDKWIELLRNTPNGLPPEVLGVMERWRHPPEPEAPK